MGVLGWVAAIAAGWFAASLVLAAAWALAGRRIFRRPPQPVVNEHTDGLVEVFEHPTRGA